MKPEIQFAGTQSADNASFDWGRLTWFASAAQQNATGVTVGRCILKPGMSNPRHLHPNCEEVLVVMSGHIRHTGAAGTEVEMAAGDTITIPAGTWHCARNIGKEEASLFIAFSSAARETVGET